jgi:amino acid transporter
MAYAFAEYANRIGPQWHGIRDDAVLVVYAVGSIVVLTAINLLGVREGKWTQNLLTVTKVLGLGIIMTVGFLYVMPVHVMPIAPKPPTDFSWADIGLAMIFILFTYGGWSEMAFVAAEVKSPRKNILRAMWLGTVAVTVIYVAINAAFLHALGFEGLQHSKAVAADVLELGIGRWASSLVSLLICISALGAINGQIFTGARIYYAMGREHRLYAWLGRWNAQRGTPASSLLIQCAITLALVVGFGLRHDGFESMVIFTTPVFWLFLLLVGVAIFVLRHRDPTIDRPYRVPGYPLTPIVFCLFCSAMVYSSISYAIHNSSWEALWSIVVLLIGIAVSFFA